MARNDLGQRNSWHGDGWRKSRRFSQIFPSSVRDRHFSNAIGKTVDYYRIATRDERVLLLSDFSLATTFYTQPLVFAFDGFSTSNFLTFRCSTVTPPSAIVMNHASNDTQAVKLTGEEVAKHGSREDCWVIIHGRAYDVTEFMPDHPGGPKIVRHKITGRMILF